MNGSADYWDHFGLEALLDDTNSLYVQDNALSNETRYRARFYLNPNGLAMGATDVLDLFAGYNGADPVFVVQLQKPSAVYQIRAGLLNDAGTWSYTSWYEVQNAWTALEIDYEALVTSGALTLYINDVSKQVLKNVDNDTRTIASVRLGAQGVDAGTSGSLYFDDFVSRRFTYIGLLPDPGVADITVSAQAGWNSRQYTYSADIPHAVTAVSGSQLADSYDYDANGNMTCRKENGTWFIQTYNAENRIASITRLSGGDCTTPGNYASKWDFAYDGDGVRTVTLTTPYDANGLPQASSLTSYYFGGAYEVTGSTVKKYYSFAGQMIAMRDGEGLKYMLSDHLGSMVAITDDNGTLKSQQRYLPFGGERELPNYPTTQLTDYAYTGQRELDPGMGGLTRTPECVNDLRHEN